MMRHLSTLLILSCLILSCRDRTHLVVVPPCEPREETCNGVDDDCDGKVDENLFQQCDNSCGPGRITCNAGVWSECSAPLPKTEICNGKDDNCDGRIDEDEEIGVAPCYPGATTDLLHGECRWGVKRCIGGAFVCQGAVVPVSEECNGKDDDCDGQVDEGTAGGLDLVFAVDYSGSMIDKIQNLQAVTAQWAQKYATRTDIRMALLGIPGDLMGQDGMVTVIHNLDTPAVFATSFGQHGSASGGGEEPSLDAIYQLAQTTNPLGMTWASGSRRAVVIYTDEMPQSYLSPIVTETQAKSLAASNGLRVFVFTSDQTWYNWSPRPFSASTALEANLDDVVQQGSCR